MRRRAEVWPGAIVTVTLLAAVFPSPAPAESAIEPPIAYLSPAQFQQEPVTHGGVEVTYTCPSYPGGDARDYGVRFSNGDARGNDGRLIASGPYWVGEAAPLPGSSPGTCRSELLLPNSPYPAALFLGPIAWQVYRRCPACQGGWEVAPLSWIILTPNVEGAELSGPRRIYAGYLTRFTFHASVDLSGTEIAVQGIGRKFGSGGGWTDLARAPYDPDGENAFFLKLPAGTHKLRVNIYFGGLSQGLPYEEVRVLPSKGPRATSGRDDGHYSSRPRSFAEQNQASFEVADEGKVLRKLMIAIPVTCQDASPSLTTAMAGLRFAQIAPDGTVTGRMLSRGQTPAYVTLEGHLRHRRFHGTVTTAFSSCRGSREFTAAPGGGY
jgi:hypothetical protein